MSNTILVADDDKYVCKSLSRYLKKNGFETSTSLTGHDTLEQIRTAKPNIVLLDFRMPDADGIELLSEIKKKWPNSAVIMMTAHGSIELAMEAVKNGAVDFITKPFRKLDVVLSSLKRAMRTSSVMQTAGRPGSMPNYGARFSDMIYCSEAMKETLSIIKDVAYSDSTVLILGESGTGKGLVAREVHENSSRKGENFVTCNCGALTESILESELFGHAKGSFTGAIEDRQGLFDLADNGTLFLDEIGEMPVHTQVKLLRALQEGEIKRVGDVKSRKINVRIIAATNQNLDELVRIGRFRQDLYYRINVIRIDLPPLRDRKEDIEPLVESFISKFNAKFNKKIQGCSNRFFYCLSSHGWSGNVRELENVIERAMVISNSEKLDVDDLPRSLLGRTSNANSSLELTSHAESGHDIVYSYMLSKQKAVEVFTKNYLSNLLSLTLGNITKAAEMAGMHRSNFKKLMRENNIEAAPFKVKTVIN